MKCFKEMTVELLVVMILVSTAAVLAADCPKEKKDICTVACGGPKDEVRDCLSAKEDGIDKTTCLCKDTYGGKGIIDLGGGIKVDFEASGCTTGMENTSGCIPCPSDDLVLYKCQIKIGEETQMGKSLCQCASKNAVEATKSEQKRRGKFPSILAKLLEALQQARSYFNNGRQ